MRKNVAGMLDIENCGHIEYVFYTTTRLILPLRCCYYITTSHQCCYYDAHDWLLILRTGTLLHDYTTKYYHYSYC